MVCVCACRCRTDECDCVLIVISEVRRRTILSQTPVAVFSPLNKGIKKQVRADNWECKWTNVGGTIGELFSPGQPR